MALKLTTHCKCKVATEPLGGSRYANVQPGLTTSCILNSIRYRVTLPTGHSGKFELDGMETVFNAPLTWSGTLEK